MRHLLKVGEQGVKTGMHQQNLAIVWAPNLFRSALFIRNVQTNNLGRSA